MRSSGGVRRQAGYAAAAASIAFATSATSESETRAIASPVAGLMTSCHSLAEDSRQWPLMKFGILVRGGAATLLMSYTFQIVQSDFTCRQLRAAAPFHRLRRALLPGRPGLHPFADQLSPAAPEGESHCHNSRQ